MDQVKGQDHFIKVDTEENIHAGLKKAKEIILSGGVVAFPTESFYGLAVNAKDEAAIQRLFAIKERRKEHPLLILIPSLETLDRYAVHVPEIAHQLIKEFWPGGLTIIFQAGPNISPLITAGTGKIGIRLSSHPIATALARTAGVPITGTSANISGRPACRNVGDVFQSLGRGVDLILDGGQTKGGTGSTILDITVEPPLVLREGMVGHERLKKFISRPSP